MTASYFVGVEVVVIVPYLAKKSLPASIGGSAKDVEFSVLNTGNSLPSFHKSRNASQPTDRSLGARALCLQGAEASYRDKCPFRARPTIKTAMHTYPRISNQR